MVTPRKVPFIVAILSMLLLMLFLTACGSSTATTTSSTPPTATPTVTSTDTPTPTPTQAAAGSDNTVSMTRSSGYAFFPTMLTVSVGTTVVWTNRTGTSHTVTSDDGKTFDSGISTPISPGASFSFNFTKPGTYTYHCRFHASMVGTIVVK